MKDTLRALVELQELEDSLRDLRLLREGLVKLTQENELTRHVFQQMLSERETQLDEVRAFCQEKEAGIKEAEDNARRARGRVGRADLLLRRRLLRRRLRTESASALTLSSCSCSPQPSTRGIDADCCVDAICSGTGFDCTDEDRSTLHLE